MRLSEIADALAALEGREADEIHIRLRNPLFKSLLAGTEGRTRNSPADYSQEELARARLLLALFECGLSTGDLAKVNDKLNAPPLAGPDHPDSASLAGGGTHYPSGLRSIIRGARAGENWLIRVRFARTNDGARSVNPSIVWEGWATEGRDGWAVDMLNGETHLGTLLIPASDLIRPLLES